LIAEDSEAIAGPKVEPKTVNTKTDNATNLFMIIFLFLSTLRSTYACVVTLQERHIT
jgi:hypothetical protein